MFDVLHFVTCFANITDETFGCVPDEGKMVNATDVLRAAKEAVEQAGIPDDLRATAFEKAIDLVSGSIALTNGKGSDHRSSPHLETPGSEQDSALLRLARKLKLDAELVGDIFHEEDGELRVVVGAGKLNRGKKGATQQLALLVCAARQAIGVEEFTSFDRVRKIAEEYRRYDRANFARSLNEMMDEFSFRGTARQREIKVSRPGWEAAARLVTQLAGGDA